MTIQEYTKSIQESSINESIKLEIFTLLNSSTGPDLDDETKAEIRLLIEKDIDTMMEEATDDLDEEDKKELEVLDVKLEEDLNAIEKQVEASVAEVEAEFAELDSLTTELNAVDEDVTIAELKDTLASQE